ncbi:MAG: hypothetical protein CVU72_07280 [Deltaproteobacteria bacterium HGW-Deltaproteobacteria-7]|nr:MAG: hypothetical protein CVU72_07280 [Deltaproteobacteria bacterium HGW-Deltaproteobacteria-7]
MKLIHFHHFPFFVPVILPKKTANKMLLNRLLKKKDLDSFSSKLFLLLQKFGLHNIDFHLKYF